MKLTCGCHFTSETFAPRTSRPASRRATPLTRYMVAGALVCTLGGFISGTELRSAHAEVLTLEQAIALAGGNNRLVKNSSLDVEKAAAQADATRARRLPDSHSKLKPISC